VKALALPLCLLGTELLASVAAPSLPPAGSVLRSEESASSSLSRAIALSADKRERILALDPEQVTEIEIRDLLSQMPAPHIILIHGGLLPVKTRMKSFTRFLTGMGYPEASIRNPANGACTYGYYDRSDKIAGIIAWYYERDGLRPMLVGHSLGGIQTVRVLHKLAGDSADRLSVWNPVTGTDEKRWAITDPLDGVSRPVVGLKVSYATAALSGGLGRVLPSEWDMHAKLRQIPDSAEEFTGFQKGLDILGGDFLGSGPSNDYHATGQAMVRNVRLRSLSAHSNLPDTSGLLKDEEVRKWIDHYQPGGTPGGTTTAGIGSGTKSARMVWAAEVWHAIKKHWVLEVQRLVRAKSPEDYAH